MKLYIPQMSVSALAESDRERYKLLDSTPYPVQLAQSVADKLLKDPTESGGLYFAHRDYCGMGLYVHEGKFMLGTVNDGRGPFPLVATFDDREEFVRWLASQSDQSMALYGEAFDNQTITKNRLMWYLQENYDPAWNSYCLYLRGEK